MERLLRAFRTWLLLGLIVIQCVNVHGTAFVSRPRVSSPSPTGTGIAASPPPSSAIFTRPTGTVDDPDDDNGISNLENPEEPEDTILTGGGSDDSLVPVNPNCTYKENKARRGKQVASFKLKVAPACCTKCDSVVHCYSWTYVTDDKTCSLLDSNSSPTGQRGVVTGSIR